MRHVDSGRFPIPDREQRAGSLASCFRTYGLIALPQRAGAPSNKFHGPCYESAKTATKTQMYFQQKRKCEINKTATWNSESATSSVSLMHRIKKLVANTKQKMGAFVNPPPLHEHRFVAAYLCNSNIFEAK